MILPSVRRRRRPPHCMTRDASSRRRSRSTTVQTPVSRPSPRRRPPRTSCRALTWAPVQRARAGLLLLLDATTRNITSAPPPRTTASLRRSTRPHSTTSCPCRGRLATSRGACLPNITITTSSLSHGHLGCYT